MLDRRSLLLSGFGLFATAASAQTYGRPYGPGLWRAPGARSHGARLYPVPTPERHAPPPSAAGSIDPSLLRQVVAYDGAEAPGTVIVDAGARFLYLVRAGGEAFRYGIGVGREGFSWNGAAVVGRKAEWPAWYPPEAMRKRQPELPESMPGGPDNPLGARALYLYQGGRDTLYRIHGTNEASSIGRAVSSGCIRMLNEAAIDLYDRVPVGTKVVVLPADAGGVAVAG